MNPIEDDNLFDIRCPFQQVSKRDGKLYNCNTLCGRVEPGSGGELRCRKCHLTFQFKVDDQARNAIGVKVRKNEITKED